MPKYPFALLLLLTACTSSNSPQEEPPAWDGKSRYADTALYIHEGQAGDNTDTTHAKYYFIEEKHLGDWIAMELGNIEGVEQQAIDSVSLWADKIVGLTCEKQSFTELEFRKLHSLTASSHWQAIFGDPIYLRGLHGVLSMGVSQYIESQVIYFYFDYYEDSRASIGKKIEIGRRYWGAPYPCITEK
jgi:hypothetical protein